MTSDPTIGVAQLCPSSSGRSTDLQPRSRGREGMNILNKLYVNNLLS